KGLTPSSLPYQALYSNDQNFTGAAQANNAFGLNALVSNVDGGDNDAFGAFALNNNIDGSSNQGFGYRALGDNVNGNGNVAIGDSAVQASRVILTSISALKLVLAPLLHRYPRTKRYASATRLT